MVHTPLIRNEAPQFNKELGKPKMTMAPSIMGLNPAEMTKGIREIKEAEMKPKQDLIETNTKKLAALKEFQDLTEEFDEKCLALSNYMGLNSKVTNAFSSMTAGGTVSDGTAFIDNVVVTAGSGVKPQLFSLQVSQLAKQDFKTTTAYTGDAALGITGTLCLNGISFSITPSMLYSDLVTQINNAGAACSVNASSFLTTPTTSVVTLQAKDVADPIDFTGTDSTTAQALFGSSTITNTSLSSLQSTGTFNNVSFTRNSNVITDFVPNAVFNLQNASGATISGHIDHNYTTVCEGFLDWIESYNKLGDFIEKHHQIKKDNYDLELKIQKFEATDDSVLYKNQILSTINRDLKSIFSQSIKVDLSKDTLSGSTTFTNATTAAGISGNLVLQGRSVSLTSDMTWQQIMNSVNAASGVTNVTMSSQVQGTSTPSTYSLKLTQGTKGIALDLNGSDASVLTAIGFDVGSDVVYSSSLTNFTDPSTAIGVGGTLLINGTSVSITSTMTHNEVLSAINAKQSTTNIKQVMVQNGTTYSTKLEAQLPAQTISLEGSTPELLSALGYETTGTLLANRVSELNVFNVLANVGISFTSRASDTYNTEGYKIELDKNKFQTALDSNFDEFLNLFAGNAQTSNSQFSVYAIPTAVTSDMAFSNMNLTVNKDTDGAVSATIHYNGKNYPAYYESGLVSGITQQVMGTKAVSSLDSAAAVSGSLKFSNSNKTVTAPVSISITSSMTWREIRDNINAMSSKTGVQATVQTAGSHQYLSLITKSKDGMNFSNSDTSALTGLGLTMPTSIQDTTYGIFDGLRIGYSGDEQFSAGTTVTTTLSMSQGVVDKAHKKLTDLLNRNTGIFKPEEERIDRQTKGLREEVKTLDRQMQTEINRFNTEFNRLYDVISKYEDLMKTLETYKDFSKKDH